ncbi:hypothetical protein Tco_0622294 [Tanacetum coccineum]
MSPGWPFNIEEMPMYTPEFSSSLSMPAIRRVTPTWVLSTYLRSNSSVPDTELVLYPLQDKLTFGDKSLDLSAFKLSRLFFSLLSSGSSSCWRSYGAEHLEGNSLSDCSLSDLELLKDIDT